MKHAVVNKNLCVVSGRCHCPVGTMMQLVCKARHGKEE